jgi:phosphohistidine phosphatase SixA
MITRIIGVRHSTAEDGTKGLRLILNKGKHEAIALARILKIQQLVDQRTIVFCSPKLEAYMTAIIIARFCGGLTVITHPDLLEPYSLKPMHEAIKFVIDETERHEATAVVIVHHGGQVEGMCTDVARELTHKNHLSSLELDALEYAQAFVLDFERGGIRANYLNPS